MPEEINRVVTDRISDLSVRLQPTPSPTSGRGLPTAQIHLVGNVMIDTLLPHLERARQRPTLAGSLGFSRCLRVP